MTDFSTPPIGLAAWMICLGCGLWLALMAIKLSRIVRGDPAHPPNAVLANSSADLTRRVSVLEDSFESFRAELKRDKEDIMIAGERRAEKLHNRINTVLEAVSELRGRMEIKK